MIWSPEHRVRDSVKHVVGMLVRQVAFQFQFGDEIYFRLSKWRGKQFISKTSSVQLTQFLLKKSLMNSAFANTLIKGISCFERRTMIALSCSSLNDATEAFILFLKWKMKNKFFSTESTSNFRINILNTIFERDQRVRSRFCCFQC